MTSRGRVLFVDRRGALAVWSLMEPVAEALETRGWQTGFVCMADDSGRAFSPDSAALGMRVIDVPRQRWPGDLLRQRRAFEKGFTEVLRELRPDVVHVNFAVPGIWARRAAKRMGVSWVIATQHELRDSMSRHLRLGLWATRGLVDVQTYVSDAVAASFGTQSLVRLVEEGETPPRHTVIRNGVDESALAEAAAPVTSRVPGRLVAPGRLVRVKGHRRILDAFARLRAHRPDTELVIAGSGPEESLLRRRAARLGVSEAVRFTGWLPRKDLWSLVAGAEAAVFASMQEGFGLTLAEAALLETPVVASRIAAFREVLADDEGAAWWFEPKDSDELADTLARALSAPPDKRRERVDAARYAAGMRATRTVMTRQYVRLYERLSAEP